MTRADIERELTRAADLVALLDAVELDMEIPLEAFIAVAEILAYVYRANGRQPPGPGSSGGRR